MLLPCCKRTQAFGEQIILYRVSALNDCVRHVGVASGCWQYRCELGAALFPPKTICPGEDFCGSATRTFVSQPTSQVQGHCAVCVSVKQGLWVHGFRVQVVSWWMC